MKAYYILKLKHLDVEQLAEGCISMAILRQLCSREYRRAKRSRPPGDRRGIRREQRWNPEKLQDSLEREVQLTVMQYYRWETMKKEGDKFAESVLRKHVLVSGVEL